MRDLDSINLVAPPVSSIIPPQALCELRGSRFLATLRSFQCSDFGNDVGLDAPPAGGDDGKRRSRTLGTPAQHRRKRHPGQVWISSSTISYLSTLILQHHSSLVCGLRSAVLLVSSISYERCPRPGSFLESYACVNDLWQSRCTIISNIVLIISIHHGFLRGRVWRAAGVF